MELTAKEILEKHLGEELTQPNVVLTYVESRTILAAMKELAELAFDAGGDREYAENFGVVPNKYASKQEFINSLFPESKDSGIVVSNGITSTE